MKNFIKRYKLVICIFLLVLFGIAGYKTYEYIKLQKLINTPVNELTEEQKLEDFEFLYNSIIEDYPYLEVNKRKYGVDWASKKEEYIELIKTTNNFEQCLKDILADLNNDHTNILDATTIKNHIEIYKNLKQKSRAKFHLKTLENPLVLKIYNINNSTSINVEEQEIVQVENAVVGDIVEGKVASIYIPKMLNDYVMEKDKELIEGYLEDIKGYQALVIDIRGNTGGSGPYWTDFLLPKILKTEEKATTYMFTKGSEYIKDFLDVATGIFYKIPKVEDLDTSSLTNLPPEVLTDFEYYIKNDITIKPSKDSIKFDGNIYLLVDGGVFSAAEGLAIFAKESGFATIIGQQTKGDGGGFEILYKMLPNSGYIYSFPGEMATSSDGTSSEEYGTTPDYIVNSAKFPNEYINLDECIRKVLELEEIDISEIK